MPFIDDDILNISVNLDLSILFYLSVNVSFSPRAERVGLKAKVIIAFILHRFRDL